VIRTGSGYSPVVGLCSDTEEPSDSLTIGYLFSSQMSVNLTRNTLHLGLCFLDGHGCRCSSSLLVLLPDWVILHSSVFFHKDSSYVSGHSFPILLYIFLLPLSLFTFSFPVFVYPVLHFWSSQRNHIVIHHNTHHITISLIWVTFLLALLLPDPA